MKLKSGHIKKYVPPAELGQTNWDRRTGTDEPGQTNWNKRTGTDDLGQINLFRRFVLDELGLERVGTLRVFVFHVCTWNVLGMFRYVSGMMWEKYVRIRHIQGLF